MAAGSVRNPRMGSEVTEEWVEHMLTCYERRRDPGAAVEVISYEVNPGAKPGENVASELIKMWVETKLTKEEEEEEEEEEENKRSSSQERKTSEEKHKMRKSAPKIKEYNLMMKFNSGSEMDREYTRYINADLNELLIYSDVILELNAFQDSEAQGRYPVKVPEFIYGVCNGDEYVLVMQDVGVLGYKTQVKEKGLDLTHTLMAVEQLARLHALSHAYHQKHNFLTRFPSFNTDDRLVGFLAEFITVFYDFVVEALGEQENLGHIIGKLKENRGKLFANFKTLASRDTPGHRVICLVHGDAWTNNLMYLDSKQSPQTPEDLLLIDWGLVGWRNAIFDLHQIVYNCTSLSLRQQHLQEILERYHGTFTAATRDLGAPVPNYDLPEFLKEWERTALFGLIQSGIFANSIVLSEKAREGFVKGTPSTGLWSLLAKGFAKVMVPLVMRGWFMNAIMEDSKRKFKPLLDEMKSGNNKLLNSTLADILREANDRGLLDP